MYYNYALYFRIFPNSEWQFLVTGRVKFKSYIDYERHLSELRRVLNKNSVYAFRVVSCYEKDKERELDLPF